MGNVKWTVFNMLFYFVFNNVFYGLIEIDLIHQNIYFANIICRELFIYRYRWYAGFC